MYPSKSRFLLICFGNNKPAGFLGFSHSPAWRETSDRSVGVACRQIGPAETILCLSLGRIEVVSEVSSIIAKCNLCKGWLEIGVFILGSIMELVGYSKHLWARRSQKTSSSRGDFASDTPSNLPIIRIKGGEGRLVECACCRYIELVYHLLHTMQCVHYWSLILPFLFMPPNTCEQTNVPIYENYILADTRQ